MQKYSDQIQKSLNILHTRPKQIWEYHKSLSHNLLIFFELTKKKGLIIGSPRNQMTPKQMKAILSFFGWHGCIRWICTWIYSKKNFYHLTHELVDLIDLLENKKKHIKVYNEVKTECKLHKWPQPLKPPQQLYPMR